MSKPKINDNSALNKVERSQLVMTYLIKKQKRLIVNMENNNDPQLDMAKEKLNKLKEDHIYIKEILIKKLEERIKKFAT